MSAVASEAGTGQPLNPLREGLGRRKNPDPATVVLFGASGDLTRRKLMPALFRLSRSGLLPAKLAVVGVARREKSDASFRQEMREAVRAHVPDLSMDDRAWSDFEASLYYHVAPFEEQQAYTGLGQRLEGLERKMGLPGNRLYYLATAPEHFAAIVRFLGASGLARSSGDGRGWARVIVEKPFGRDLRTARELNGQLLEVLREDQVFRIDHYLGKETVQNLLAFRFANGIFEPLWNHKYVSHVQVTVAEDLGVEGRGGYYDGAGVVRDMVENHMLQLLSLVAMEPPVSIDADAIRNEKVKVLQSVRRIAPSDVARRVVHGQYGPGTILGKSAPGYLQEPGVPAASRTPTYVAMRLEIDNWRWAGVPFLLRSGKRLPRRATEISIQFHKPPMQLFGEATASTVAPNALIINIQPDEGISLRFGAKLPGPDIQVGQVKMDFRYGTSFGVPSPEAYERLLLDALGGDSTLFTRRDEVEAAWAIVDGAIGAWEGSDERPCLYAAGSWGPAEAGKLFAGIEGSWRRI